MKTLHYQQDFHHNSDIRNKNILTSKKSEENIEHPKNNMSSLFAPFHHFGYDNHTLVPFLKMEKQATQNEEHAEFKSNEVTKSIIEAYNKQIALSLDATQKLHKEFIDQITGLYKINQQFWNTFLFSQIK
jgi:hypothetical protein